VIKISLMRLVTSTATSSNCLV